MNLHVGAIPPSPTLAGHPQWAEATIKMLQVATIVGEILLIANAMTGAGWMSLIIGHLAIIGSLGLFAIALDLARVETSALQIFILMTFTGGPIGSMAALIGQHQVWQPSSDALDQWYKTIAPAETPAVTLVDMIMDGRLVRQQSRLPRPYDALLSDGTMQEKQALLAYLANAGDQRFVDTALSVALRSPDQRVRVQAAAVAAHVRGRARQLTISPSSITMPPRAGI